VPETAILIALLLIGVPTLAQAPADKPPLRVLRTGGLRVETAALLMSGQEGGTIPVAALAVPLPGTGERARVAVLLEIDGAEAMEGRQGDLLRLEICLYAVTTDASGSGRVAGSRMDTVEIDLARLGPGLEKSGLKYAGELELPPGDYALRALVRNAATGEVGLRMLPLPVPDYRQSETLLLPPLLPEPADAWLVARGAGIKSLAPPLSLDKLPSARPILGPSEEIVARVPAWRLGTNAANTALQLEIRRPGGARVAAFPLTVSSREPGGTDGFEILTASAQIQGVEVGVYELRAVLSNGPATAEPAGALGTPFVLLEKGSEGEVWAALTKPKRSVAVARVSSPAADHQVPVKGKKTRRIDAGAVGAGYRKALSRLAEGDREGGRSAVRELEASVLTGDRPSSSANLIEVQLNVAKDLARKDPETLIPLITLHQILYRESVRKQAFLLSTHDRELVFELVDLYVVRSGSPEGRRRAAKFLMGLGAEMTWNAPPSLRARLFRQILAYDEHQHVAILCMAIDSERQGKYAEAAGTLERLLQRQPRHSEARLRLALNLVRLGKIQEARKHLQELAASDLDAEVWPHAVAFQELGRIVLAAGDLDGAEKILRQGLQRLPDDDKLALQLALVRELRKDPRGARDAVSRLTVQGAASIVGGEARHRYNRIPLEQLEQAWSELQRSAAEQLPVLAAALGLPAAVETPRNTP
ncbi:MAG TPA: tetratricopeptide repeat protein, partial [Thermoanaerobaculia bacterium]|nr:tetratricopeptide repeat protein [Thermoanaerobaculia bacterium]